MQRTISGVKLTSRTRAPPLPGPATLNRRVKSASAVARVAMVTGARVAMATVRKLSTLARLSWRGVARRYIAAGGDWRKRTSKCAHV